MAPATTAAAARLALPSRLFSSRRAAALLLTECQPPDQPTNPPRPFHHHRHHHDQIDTYDYYVLEAGQPQPRALSPRSRDAYSLTVTGLKRGTPYQVANPPCVCARACVPRLGLRLAWRRVVCSCCGAIGSSAVPPFE